MKNIKRQFFRQQGYNCENSGCGYSALADRRTLQSIRSRDTIPALWVDVQQEKVYCYQCKRQLEYLIGRELIALVVILVEQEKIPAEKRRQVNDAIHVRNGKHIFYPFASMRR